MADGVRTRGGFAGLGPPLTAFLVVDVVLVAAFLVLLTMQMVNNPRSEEPAALATETTPGPETTPERSVPAGPDDHRAYEAFVLPSRNIWCSMSEDSVTCTIGEYSYEPPATPEDCEGSVGAVLTVTAEEGAAMPCVAERPARPQDAPVLEYGEASTVGEMTCHSSRNGATCRHNPSGEGFSVARAGYTIL